MKQRGIDLAPAEGGRHHIDAVAESYRLLRLASSVRDLGAQFTSAVSRMLPQAHTLLLFRPAGGALWENTADGTPAGSGPGILSPSEERTAYNALRTFPDGSSLGVVVENHEPGGPIVDDDLVSLEMLTAFMESAYQEILHRRQEKDLIFSLNHRLLQLNSLIDTGIEVSRFGGIIPPHQLALQRAASLTNASRGWVTVSGNGRIIETVSFPPGMEGPSPRDRLGSIATSFSFGECTYAFLLSGKESRNGAHVFEGTDQMLLDALARQVHASLENRYLHAQALEKQRMEQDVAVAASIQKRILPTDLPHIAGYEVEGVNIPSRSVGGDYYDCIPLADGRLALVIADVAGKGVPAALLVSSLHASLAAYLESGTPLVPLMQRLNRVICHAATDDKFITAFLGLLTPSTGELHSVNAGHNPVYWRRGNGTVDELIKGGVPLGMLDMDFPYEEDRIVIQAGEHVLLYTDGITEAQNEQSQLFDSDVPLKEFFRRQNRSTPRDFIDELLASLKRFTGDAPQSDDITALHLVRR
jgi:serine phosphatase RsbU (regulator of sigma subunit)